MKENASSIITSSQQMEIMEKAYRSVMAKRRGKVENNSAVYKKELRRDVLLEAEKEIEARKNRSAEIEALRKRVRAELEELAKEK